MVRQLDSNEPSPGRVLELIRDCVTRRQENLIVFWVQWLSDRAELAQALRLSSADLAVIPLIVREVLFDNPNAVMADLARLLDTHKPDVEGLVTGSDVLPRQVVIVLISRARLNVPQISSPVSMPSWFPCSGGHTVHCLIEDLEASADVPLNAPEVRIEDICVALFHVEGLLLKRLGRQIIAKPHSSNALFEVLKMHGAEGASFQEFLDGSNHV